MKVHPYLGSESWDTRIAAGQAVEAIVKNVPKWAPTANASCGQFHISFDWKCCYENCFHACALVFTDDTRDDSKKLAGLLSLDQFDIQTVLTSAASLLASEGTEFDVEEEIGLLHYLFVNVRSSSIE